MILAMGCAGLRHMAENIEGTYYGYLPCAGCPGIHYELSLNPDFTFSETMQYEGTADVFFFESTYRLTRDSVIILKNKKQEEGMSRFAFVSGKLEMLSLSGEKIESGFPERYILTKEKPVFVKEVEPIMKTGFRATGNEPFWGLEIEFQNVLKFTSLTEEYPELTLHMPDPGRPGDLSLITYSAKTYNAEMEVAISREECRDTMKDTIFPYAVTVSVRPDHTGDYTVFRGCGRYLGNYRLNDIWTLEKINGEPIDIPDSRQYPTLEIDLAKEVIFGYGGCNRFHGRAEMMNNTLLTGSILSTKMLCIDTQAVENKFLGTLSGKKLEFKVTDDKLVLTDGEMELLFKRAD